LEGLGVLFDALALCLDDDVGAVRRQLEEVYVLARAALMTRDRLEESGVVVLWEWDSEPLPLGRGEQLLELPGVECGVSLGGAVDLQERLLHREEELEDGEQRLRVIHAERLDLVVLGRQAEG